MKLFDKESLEVECSVFAAPAGTRITHLALNYYDVRALRSMSPHRLAEWLNNIACRFMPPEKNP